MAMDITRWDPWKDLRDEIDRVFDSFFGRYPAISKEQEGYFVPAIDVEETEKEYIVKAELPGLSKDDIKISLRDNSITIYGERKKEKEEKGKTYHRVEMVYGKFSRTIELPEEIVPDKAKAEYKNGILTVTLPKSEKAKPKEIEIEIK